MSLLKVYYLKVHGVGSTTGILQRMQIKEYKDKKNLNDKLEQIAMNQQKFNENQLQQQKLGMELQRKHNEINQKLQQFRMNYNINIDKKNNI